MIKVAHKKAFSMITSLVVIVMMATIGVYVLNTSSKIVKDTGAQYQREQAALYAKSYTEYAILAVTANESNVTSKCLGDIDGDIGTPEDGTGYKIRVRIAYIGDKDLIDECSNTRELGYVTTKETPLQIIVDTYVQYKELDHPDISAAPYMTYHKRTIQKI